MYRKRFIMCDGIRHFRHGEIPRFEWIVGEDASPSESGWSCLLVKEAPTLSWMWFCPDCAREAERMVQSGLTI